MNVISNTAGTQTRSLKVALVGSPNSGKTSLFNMLTGGHQKVANYPGVTVERREGLWALDASLDFQLLDLPGTYSLTPRSPDEAVTYNVLFGTQEGETQPDLVMVVVDSTALAVQLRLVLELKAQTNLPLVVAMNMADLAARDGLEIDASILTQELGVPVIPTVAVRKHGVQALGDFMRQRPVRAPTPAAQTTPAPSIRAMQVESERLAKAATVKQGAGHRATQRLDAVVLHPIAGPLILAALLFLVFQAVFAWAEAPMDMIDAGVVALQGIALEAIPEGLLQSLVVDGLLAGVGSVVIFLPQILILFLFILVLEASGYLTRAAFLMDKIMGGVGLNGRAFIPLLSGFACAIPAIMATRTIDEHRDRLTTILITPLMTCSARLPVYTLIIAAFIPNQPVLGGAFGLQGLVMFTLYAVGIVSALIVAAILRATVTRGENQVSMMMVMPRYQLPRLRDLALGLWQRAWLFLRRAGTIIMAVMVVLWVLASFPAPPEGATGPAITYSFAGIIGNAVAWVFAPIGFTWEMVVALIPGMAAREVAVAALGTVYSLSGSEDAVVGSLVEVLRNAWTLPAALAFLAWYVFAPQCLPTIAVARRETNSRGWAVFMLAYLFTMAYVAAGATYWIARGLLN